MKTCLYYFHNIVKYSKKSFDDVINLPAHLVKLELIQLNFNFENLLKPFKTIVWNAMKHGQVIKMPSNPKIKFVSNIKNQTRNENIEILTYMEFVKLTKELYSVIYLLNRFHHIILLERIRTSLLKYIQIFFEINKFY